MATKSYALSKKKVCEMITEKFGETGSVDIADVIAIFEAKSGGAAGATTLVYSDEGEVTAKRCSYFGVFFRINEFGKRGDTYGYQSKLAESLVRKARTAAINAKKLADEELADDSITVDEWREKLSEIEEMKDARVEITSIDDAPEYFETAEGAKEYL